MRGVYWRGINPGLDGHHGWRSGVVDKVGKVVIRPIAFKPVASPGVQAISPPTNGGVVGGGSTASFVVHSSGGLPVVKPDPRYTSAPSLAKGVIHHYGSTFTHPYHHHPDFRSNKASYIYVAYFYLFFYVHYKLTILKCN
ncbi:hypothetical protein E2C01_050797 [Portunus trituberculatus]|uniref:Uncharacterized protein n=1 Tax=Portunus trituberculatus TaxID=210409 RepID=A0A5B7G9X5_PORTR|nr:hypothetical protein [Portunus trituberculatus]